MSISGFWSPLGFLATLEPAEGGRPPPRAAAAPVANGASLACVLAAGWGWAALGLLAGAVSAWPPVGVWLTYLPSRGPISGITTLAVLIWAGTWLNLRRRWSGRHLEAGLAAAALLGLLIWGAGGATVCALWRCLEVGGP